MGERGARRCLFGEPDLALLHQQLEDLQQADLARARERFGYDLADEAAALGCEPLRGDDEAPGHESEQEDAGNGVQEPQTPAEEGIESEAASAENNSE